MRVLIVGYGNMGKEVEKVLLQREHEITARVDSQKGIGDVQDIRKELLEESEAVIEFSLPSAVKKNAELYLRSGTPAVIGTTGWEQDRGSVKEMTEKSGSALLWGSNFSIGAHIMFALVNQAAAIIDRLPEFDIMAYELHHSKKKDSPSGTALTIANGILANMRRKTRIVTEKLDRRIEPEELHVASVRGGTIPGIHTVLLDSAADTIEIKHSARTRGGFALGAVLAAEWLVGKKGFFQVEDFIQGLITR